MPVGNAAYVEEWFGLHGLCRDLSHAAALEILKSLGDLFAAVHDEWAAANDGFVDRFARHYKNL